MRSKHIIASGLVAAAFLTLVPEAFAQRGGRGGGGGHGGGGVRAQGATSVNRAGASTHSRGGNVNTANRGGNVNSGNRNNINSGNRNINTANVNNVNVNRNVNVSGNGYNNWGGYDDHYHPVARGVAIGATAAVIGSMIYSLPPSCAPRPYGAMTYYYCGNVWYQPQYQGDNITYVVVNAPG